MYVECLLEATPDVRVDVEVRFLQVVARRIARRGRRGQRFVDATFAGDRQILAGDEATERARPAGGLPLRDFASPRMTRIEVAAGHREEPIAGTASTALVREWQAKQGAIVVQAEPVGEELFKLRVDVMNTTYCAATDRNAALRKSFVWTHAVLRSSGGSFVSASGPPRRAEVRACRRSGLWPVRVGRNGERQTMLAAPLELEDYPCAAARGQVAPGIAEVDPLVVLTLVGMSDVERRALCADDPRARAMIERVDALPEDALRHLRDTLRRLRPVARSARPSGRALCSPG
jgi:hydrogenase maturation protease